MKSLERYVRELNIKFSTKLVGYVSHSRPYASMGHEICTRYLGSSRAENSNSIFEEAQKVFTGMAMATSVVDRL